MSVVISSRAVDHMEAAVRDYFDHGRPANGLELVHERSRERGGIFRFSALGEQAVIIKTWRLNRDSDRLKRLAWMSNTRREWRIHRYLHAVGVRVPAPYAFREGQGRSGPYELIVVEDLGPLTDGLSYLKARLRAGDEPAALWLEDEVIGNTVRMVRSGALDIDNKLNNFGITAGHKLYRLDLECARRWRFRSLPAEPYGAMLGHLLSSHAFACQPHLARTEAFAGRLAEALDAPAAALEYTRTCTERILRRQHEQNGIDSRVALPW